MDPVSHGEVFFSNKTWPCAMRLYQISSYLYFFVPLEITDILLLLDLLRVILSLKQSPNTHILFHLKERKKKNLLLLATVRRLRKVSGVK